MRITVLVSLFAAAFVMQPLAPAAVVVIRGATIISATDDPPAVDGIVVIRGDRIADVGPRRGQIGRAAGHAPTAPTAPTAPKGSLSRSER